MLPVGDEHEVFLRAPPEVRGLARLRGAGDAEKAEGEEPLPTLLWIAYLLAR
jgi:hypothetical protein